MNPKLTTTRATRTRDFVAGVCFASGHDRPERAVFCDACHREYFPAEADRERVWLTHGERINLAWAAATGTDLLPASENPVHDFALLSDESPVRYTHVTPATIVDFVAALLNLVTDPAPKRRATDDLAGIELVEVPRG